MPESTQAISYKGRKPTSAMIVELWTNAEGRFKNRDERIKQAQGLRRYTDKVDINPRFLANHPEINRDQAISLLPEREQYERDLVTKAGSVEPQIGREPLDVTDTAIDQAEEYEAYQREVAADDEHGVPFQTFIENGTEDGEYGVVALPAELDSDGIPDFYDRLTERALAQMPKAARDEYSRDDQDRRGRYVRRNPDGSRKRKAEYEIGPHPAYDRAEGMEAYRAKKADYDRKNARSQERHADTVRRYMLRHAASTFRTISALDCYPLLSRGRGRQRWSVDGLIERSLLTREELVKKKLGWAMLGDRLLLPRGVTRANSGIRNDFYLYTAYLLCEDEDGCLRPCIFYTVGGASSWWDGTTPKDGKDDQEVACIDLYAECGLTDPVWTYEWGLHTGDSDPDFYGRPAIYPFRNRILNIETLETAANVAVPLGTYTGHTYKPDAKLMEIDPEAVVESETHSLRRPIVPGPGEIEPWAGDVVPFQQSQIGRDHWQQLANYKTELQQLMAIDAMKDAESGHQLLVQSGIGMTAKRHIREAAIRAYKFCLETDALIRLAAYKNHKVKWPILTSKEKPVGHEVRSRADIAEFDPDWLGEDENPRLNVTYGEEFNLARADLEMAAAERGFRALKHVAAAFGEEDVMNLRFEIARDQAWKSPANMALMEMLVDKHRGMTRMRKAALMQAQARMTKNGLPGAELGLPSATFQQAGAQMAQGGGGGKPTIGASVRGGIVGASKTGDALALQAQPQQMGAA
jgi:hypothetical protein